MNKEQREAVRAMYKAMDPDAAAKAEDAERKIHEVLDGLDFGVRAMAVQFYSLRMVAEKGESV
jgi:hypothetical protein